MGQYFIPVIGNSWSGEFTPHAWIHPHESGDGLKFMEHSYTRNAVVTTVMDYIRLPKDVSICDYLAKRVVWAGDYSEVKVTKGEGYNLYHKAMELYKQTKIDTFVGYDPRLKYIVNISKGQWADCTKIPYAQDSLMLSALAALTATKMGGNVGDFMGAGSEQIGLWSGDLICSTTTKSKIPRNYSQLALAFGF